MHKKRADITTSKPDNLIPAKYQLMGILINPKGRSLLHPEPLGRGASGHSVIHPEMHQEA